MLLTSVKHSVSMLWGAILVARQAGSRTTYATTRNEAVDEMLRRRPSELQRWLFSIKDLRPEPSLERALDPATLSTEYCANILTAVTSLTKLTIRHRAGCARAGQPLNQISTPKDFWYDTRITPGSFSGYRVMTITSHGNVIGIRNMRS
jgi:hypothetical protein